MLLAGNGQVRANDLVTLSGATYHDVHALRADPDGVTWRHAGGVVKVDFADSPENVRRAYHFDPAKAEAYRETQARVRRQADEVAQRDARGNETRQSTRMQAALARMTAQDGTGADGATVFRRSLSPAASDATRATAAQMQADAERRAADAANPDAAHFVPALPSALGPRPVNPYMDTPNSKEFAASLYHSPTGAAGNFVPTTFDANRTTVLDTPIYLTRSYYEDVERSEAFARGVPFKQP